MVETPLVTIIIPLYNKREIIGDTINSVLNQDYTNLEVLVVDDGSTDGSAEYIRMLSNSRIRLLEKENGGVSSARNWGIKHSNGDWILFLDADDILLKDCISTLIKECSKGDIIVGNFYTQYGTKRSIGCTNVKTGLIPSNLCYKEFFRKRIPMRAGSYIIKRSLVLNELFDERLRRLEDAESLFRWLNHNPNLYVLSIPVMVYNLSYNDLSKPILSKWENDFGFYLPFTKGEFGKNCLLGMILSMTLNAYPQKIWFLLKRYKFYSLYSFPYDLLNLKGKFKSTIRRIFRIVFPK
jgi:glycosyltransferase involved in cell wall biosynthesis